MIVDLFRDIVADVSSEVLSTLQAVDPSIVRVNYEHGHYPEINETLMQKEEAGFRYDKYPMIALLEDVQSDTVDSVYTKAKLRLLICHSSEYDSKSTDRYKDVIKPVLEPIYDCLVRYIEMNRNVLVGYGLQVKKTIRPHWGVRGANDTPEKNIFDDIVDVIDVRFDLKYTTNCLTTKNNQIWH